MNKNNGFMLMDILVSMAVASIIILALMPVKNVILSWLYKSEVEGVVNNIISFINVAKSEARNDNEPLTLYLDKQHIFLSKNGIEEKKFVLPDKVSITGYTGPDYSIKINSLGNITTGGASIYLTSSYGEVKTITIKVGTGYVSEKK